MGSARHAANSVPAGGVSFSRTSDQSPSWLRPSSAEPPVSCTYGGVAVLLQAVAS